jgi:hypothetical protein
LDPADTSNPFVLDGVQFLSGGRYELSLSLPDTADRIVTGINLSSNTSCNFPGALWTSIRDEVTCSTVYTGIFDWTFAYTAGKIIF